MRKLLLFSVYLFLSYRAYASGYTSNCPRACRCARQNIVYCNERNLTLIPFSIPPGTLILHLQLNQLENRATNDDMLRALTSLQRLDLHHNRLTSVPKGLAATLEYVDFRCNFIKYVGKTSLKGLTSLSELHLSQNNITNHGLSPLAFEDTQSLRILILTDNLLTKFPENFPGSLQLLRLNKNNINFVSRTALQGLKNLSNLDLSQNALGQTGIEKFSFMSLTSLKVLDLSHNFITEIPSHLPETLQELMLSNNQIEFLYSNENNGHGSLSSIKHLVRVDLSSNNLKSVETNAFGNLKLQSVQLHDNPWMCDCHLKYLKQWLSSNVLTLSSENKFCCQSPRAFTGVTLTSIDEEALKCTARNINRNINIYNVTFSSFVVKWNTPSSDPPYIRRSIVYGPLKCSNCSVAKLLTASQASEIGTATSIMKSYVSKEITASVQADGKYTVIPVENLQSNTPYAFCVFRSLQNVNTVALDQCVDVKTTAAGPVKDATIVFIPLWSIILWCVIFVLLLSCVIGFIAWKKCKRFPSKTPRRTYSHNNHAGLYPPDLIFQTNSQAPSRSHTLWPNYTTTDTDRTYAECGPANTSSSSVPSTLRNSTTVADRESDVLLQPLENRSYTVTPATSSVR